LINAGVGEDDLRDELNASYWMCIFGVNQHGAICGTKYNPCNCTSLKYPSGHPLCQMDKFDLVVSKVQALAVALDPQLKTLTRVWVVSEIGKCIKMRKDINYLLPGQVDEKYSSAEFEIKVEHCQATLKEDKVRILKQISDDLQSYSNFNRQVNSAILPAVAEALLGNAVLHGSSTDVVEALLQKGASPNARTRKGDSVLLEAAQNGNWDVVRCLLFAGAWFDHKLPCDARKDFCHLWLTSGPALDDAWIGNRTIMSNFLQGFAEALHGEFSDATLLVGNSMKNMDLTHMWVAAETQSLKKLTFAQDFNQPMEKVALPSSLQNLTFGSGFKQPMEKVALPSGVRIHRA
jgi:hypothetical protein